MTVITRNRVAAGLAAVLLAGAAAVLPAAPATAADTPLSCWIEQDIYKVGSTVYAYAFKDCINAPVPIPLSLKIESQWCDSTVHCSWETLVSGLGNVSHQCKPGRLDYLRHSRQPDDRVWCDE
jgi:hypothetical protein